ncbi:GNAT family N-acetyltransferase [Pseudomonas sp. TE50-2]|jgi:diamine N-acetyltransferase|uniref:GNAT family N-acetyltransferase n=1 Tax=Pseudomonas sp. TE50-2 TaxID=3142707 RepID=UPI003467203F
MEIVLKDVTKDNWLDIISLEITEEQENYVALNSESLAASKFYEYYVNRGIYLAGEAVGFIQYYSNHANGRPDEIFIDQLMVDINHQVKGVGTKAVALVLDEIRQMECIKSVSICYVEGHDVMRGFFERFGFKVVDQHEFEETIMRLELN